MNEYSLAKVQNSYKIHDGNSLTFCKGTNYFLNFHENILGIPTKTLIFANIL